MPVQIILALVHVPGTAKQALVHRPWLAAHRCRLTARWHKPVLLLAQGLLWLCHAFLWALRTHMYEQEVQGHEHPRGKTWTYGQETRRDKRFPLSSLTCTVLRCISQGSSEGPAALNEHITKWPTPSCIQLLAFLPLFHFPWPLLLLSGIAFPNKLHTRKPVSEALFGGGARLLTSQTFI